MSRGVTVGASIIHPPFYFLTFIGNGPVHPDKECEYLLRNYIGWLKRHRVNQMAALASGQQLVAEVNNKQHRDVGYAPATVQCGKQ